MTTTYINYKNLAFDILKCLIDKYENKKKELYELGYEDELLYQSYDEIISDLKDSITDFMIK